MFEKFTSKDSGDFRQRYQGTFGHFISGGKRTLARLDNIIADGRASYVEFSDRDGVQYLLKPDSEVEGRGFEFIPPKSSYYNTKKGIPMLVKRIPARQYQRGICDRNTAVANMRNEGVPVGFDVLVELFEEKVSAAEALEAAIKSKSTAAGVAISPQFALCLSNGIIRCYEQNIGVFTHNKGIFSVHLDSKDLWQQEITDCFKRSGFKLEIK